MWYPELGIDMHRRAAQQAFGSLSDDVDERPNVDRTILICFTNRSGSTYLGELLASTGRVGKAREFLNAPMVERISREHGIRSFAGYLRHLATTFGREGVLSMKVGIGQLAGLAESGLLDRFLPNPGFVFVERADLLAQAVSWEVARQSGAWTSEQEATGEPRYDFAAIDARIDAITHENALFRQFFAKNGLGFSHVLYEHLVDDVEGTIARIGRDLGMDGLSPSPEAVRLERQASDLNRQFAEHYQEQRIGPGQLSTPIDHLLAENAALRRALEGTVDPRLFGPPRPPARGVSAAAKAVIPQRFHPTLAKIKQALRS